MSKQRAQLLARAHAALLYLGIGYGILLAVAVIPYVQTHVIFGHNTKFTPSANFSEPEQYGLAPGKSANLYLSGTDNATLGAWFVLSDRYYRSLPLPMQTNAAEHIPTALQRRPTVLYLHGNSGDRALPLRVGTYTGFSSRLDVNVFAVDYRGFADSTGSPTVDGVAADARTAWNYLISQGADPKDVLIVGTSLGTAIASILTAELNAENTTPRGLVLLSPFASTTTLMFEYYLFGFLPLLKPLVIMPTLSRFMTRLLSHRFETLDLVSQIKCSVLIAHAEDDFDVGHAHSDVLFNAFVDPLLPAVPQLPSNPVAFSDDDWKSFATEQSTRSELRQKLVTTQNIPAFGKLDEVRAAERTLALLKLFKGQHAVGHFEGVQEVIGSMFGLL